MVLVVDKLEERKLLLTRFLEDEELYELAKELGLEIAKKFEDEYERSNKEGFAFYLSSDEREEILEEVAKAISDEKLLEFFNRVRPKDDLEVGCFRGNYYTYDRKKGLSLRSSWDEVRRDVLEALEQTGERGYAFLRAIVELYEEDEECDYWYGPSYSKILARMRDILGKVVMLTPRDFAVLKAYRIYYKSGTRRYPGHSIPLEIMPAVKRALEEWKSSKGR